MEFIVHGEGKMFAGVGGTPNPCKHFDIMTSCHAKFYALQCRDKIYFVFQRSFLLHCDLLGASRLCHRLAKPRENRSMNHGPHLIYRLPRENSSDYLSPDPQLLSWSLKGPLANKLGSTSSLSVQVLLSFCYHVNIVTVYAYPVQLKIGILVGVSFIDAYAGALGLLAYRTPADCSTRDRLGKLEFANQLDFPT